MTITLNLFKSSQSLPKETLVSPIEIHPLLALPCTMYHKATDNDFGHENFAETKFSIIVNEHYNVMTKEQIQDLISVAIVKESNVIFMDAS